MDSVRRIKREEEETKRRMELRRKNNQLQKRDAARVPHLYRWPSLGGPITSRTVKVVALSLSVATVAFICNYIRPNLADVIL